MSRPLRKAGEAKTFYLKMHHVRDEGLQLQGFVLLDLGGAVVTEVTGEK